jgi:hypothetical protein
MPQFVRDLSEYYNNAKICALLLNDNGEGNVKIDAVIHRFAHLHQEKILILKYGYHSFVITIKTDYLQNNNIDIICSIYLIYNSDEIHRINLDRAFSTEFRRFSHFDINISTLDPKLTFYDSISDIHSSDPANNFPLIFKISYPQNKNSFQINPERKDLLSLSLNIQFKLVEDFTPRSISDWSPRVIERDC